MEVDKCDVVMNASLNYKLNLSYEIQCMHTWQVSFNVKYIDIAI
jgi:hypothetical protein